MPKMKSHKGLSKRIKVTASGKIKRKRCGNSHLMRTKNAKRRRRLAAATTVCGVRAKKILSQIAC